MNFETPNKPEETIEAKKERLRPVIEWAIDHYDNHAEKSLEEIAVEATRKFKGKIQTIPDLVILETDDDGVNLAGIRNGEPTASATMLWTELLDLKKMEDVRKEKK